MSYIKIRTITNTVTIKKIDINKYIIFVYIILRIYLSGRKNTKAVNIYITRKIYIIKGLKTKIFIGINIIRPEDININISRKKIYIGFYEITVNLIIKSRLITSIYKPILFKEDLIIPARNLLLIVIQYINVLNNRNFLFKSTRII